MNIGDKVRYPSMPDMGVGEIVDTYAYGPGFTVKFRTTTCSCILPQSLEVIDDSEISILECFRDYGIKCLWHMTHKNNVNEILEYGIFNYYDARKMISNRVDISDPEAQKWRNRIEPCYERKIHDYVPLYINPKNPMLSVRRHLQNDLCLIEIDLNVMLENNYLITDGNAASPDTRFFNTAESITELPWDVLRSNYWPDHKDGKRKMCAEVLIYPKVETSYIAAIHCNSHQTKNSIADLGYNVELSHNLFF